jgi:hypothetical protein
MGCYGEERQRGRQQNMAILPSGKANAVARVRQSQRPGSVNGLACGGSAGVFQLEEFPSTQDNTAQWM